MMFAREGAKARRCFARRGAERKAVASARSSPSSEIEGLLAQPGKAPLRLCANQFLSTLAPSRLRVNRIEATR